MLKKAVLMSSLMMAHVGGAALVVSHAHADIVVYTDRPAAKVQPIADGFEKKTGTKVVVVELAYPKIIERLAVEGATTPADLLYVKDMVYAGDLEAKSLLKPMSAEAQTFVNATVPQPMRHPKGLWSAVQSRGRTIMYEPSRVKPTELAGYEALADSKWEGRLCVRTSKAAYNEALVSGLIERHGATNAKTIVAGWVKNLAAPPFANDTLVLEAIANGVCDVGITNTYYLGQMIAKNPVFTVKPHFADQATGAGVFMNGEMIGVTNTSKQIVVASKFVEYLLEDQPQLDLATAGFTYPAKTNLMPATLIKNWGTFKIDATPWSVLGEPARIQRARDLMIEVGYL